MRYFFLFVYAFFFVPSIQAQFSDSTIRTGQDRAIFFVGSEYHSSWGDLVYTSKEAKRIAHVLKEGYGFDTIFIENPSKADIVSMLESLQKEKVSDNDQLIVFFTGHGDLHEVVEKKKGQGFFITKEVKRKKTRFDALSYLELNYLIKNIACKHVLLIIDACYSGSFLLNNELNSTSELLNSKIRFNHQQFSQETCKIAINSAPSFKKYKSPSPFTNAFEKVLRKYQNSRKSYLSIGEVWEETLDSLKGKNPLPYIGYISRENDNQSFFFFPDGRYDDANQVTIEFYNYWKDSELWIDNSFYKKLAQVAKVQLKYYKGEHTFKIIKGGITKWEKKVLIERHTHKLITFENKNIIRDPIYTAPDLVYVEGGEFFMGCTKEQRNCDNDEPVRKVNVSSFWISKTEITNKQFCLFLNNNAEEVAIKNATKKYRIVSEHEWGVKKDANEWQPQKGFENHPLINVSWYGAKEYVRWLSLMTGENYRLPTEEEWEYAARGGISSEKYLYAGSDTLEKVGWYQENSSNSTHTVSLKGANELGIYDMSGNVWEWCDSKYKLYNADESNFNDCVIRGGSWWDINNGYGSLLRVAVRDRRPPNSIDQIIGFRVCRTP